MGEVCEAGWGKLPPQLRRIFVLIIIIISLDHMIAIKEIIASREVLAEAAYPVTKDLIRAFVDIVFVYCLLKFYRAWFWRLTLPIVLLLAFWIPREVYRFVSSASSSLITDSIDLYGYSVEFLLCWVLAFHLMKKSTRDLFTKATNTSPTSNDR